MILYHPTCEKHLVPARHTETPERVRAIRQVIDQLKQMYPNSVDILEDFAPPSDHLLSQVHTEAYLNHLRNPIFSKETPVHISTLRHPDDSQTQDNDQDTYLSKFSLPAAKLAVGSVLKAIDLVVDSTYRSAFCSVRPPGHHCGFKGNTDKVIFVPLCSQRRG